MTCDRARAELKAFLDGELGWRDGFLVKRHLSGCTACRAEREALSAFHQEFFADFETEGLPESLRARLVALAPEAVPVAPKKRVPSLAWGALGGACLATLAVLYLRPAPAPVASKSAVTLGAPAAPMATASESKDDAKRLDETTENRAAAPAMKPAAPVLSRIADASARDKPAEESVDGSFDREPAKRKSRGRGGFSASSEVEFATVPLAAGLSDAALIAAVKAEGGTVASENPLALEIAPERLAALNQRLGNPATEQSKARANETRRFVRIRLKTTARVRQ